MTDEEMFEIILDKSDDEGERGEEIFDESSEIFNSKSDEQINK